MLGSSFYRIQRPFLYVYPKYQFLITCLLVQVMHETRVRLVNGQQYVASTAVLLSEMIKLSVSLIGEYKSIQKASPVSTTSTHFRQLYDAVFSSDSWKLIVPAVLFTLQTSLLYIATSNLDAATFQVTYQLRILTTVFFSVCLLGRKLSTRQWLALLLLTVGIAIVQLPSSFSLTDLRSLFIASTLETRAEISEVGSVKLTISPMKGLTAVIGASITSGLVGVYMEKVVKDSLNSVSLWTRNAQLSFFSFFPAFFIGVVWQDGAKIRSNGFFNGYNGLVWCSVLLQAFGGLMVSVCITYTDNIAKNFATTVSIVLSTLVGAILFHYTPSKAFVLGASIVVLAIYLYSSRARHLSVNATIPISEVSSRAGDVKDDEYEVSPIDLEDSESHGG